VPAQKKSESWPCTRAMQLIAVYSGAITVDIHTPGCGFARHSPAAMVCERSAKLGQQRQRQGGERRLRNAHNLGSQWRVRANHRNFIFSRPRLRQTPSSGWLSPCLHCWGHRLVKTLSADSVNCLISFGLSLRQGASFVMGQRALSRLPWCFHDPT
jgi:hypothetical protein